MTAVGQDEDAHTFGETFELLVQLIVDELAVVQRPGLIEAVRFIFRTVDVGYLAPVARVGQEENVTAAELPGRVPNGRSDILDGRLGRQEGGEVLELRLLGELRHVVCIVLAGDELAAPSTVFLGVDPVESDVD